MRPTEVVSFKEDVDTSDVEDNHRGKEHISESEKPSLAISAGEYVIGNDTYKRAQNYSDTNQCRTPKCDFENFVHRNVTCTKCKNYAIDVEGFRSVNHADAKNPCECQPKYRTFVVPAAD